MWKLANAALERIFSIFWHENKQILLITFFDHEDKAKCLGPMKVKNEGKEANETQNEGIKSLCKICNANFKKCLRPTRT